MSIDNGALEKKIENLPNAPGVYLMKNKGGKIIYVGKARELKKRVVSYFRDPDRKDPKTSLLISNITDFDFIVTDTEVEALLTEGTLIKEHRPKYNIDLKDDKNYLCLRIDAKGENFPRFTLVRHIRKDGAIYFGPYTDAKSLRDSLKWLSGIFKIRQCSDHKFKNVTRPCLYYQINQCNGPCCDLITEEEYQKNVDYVIMLLKGRNDDLIKNLSRDMVALADEERFEEAALIRDRIEAINKTIEVQKVVTTDATDRDVIGTHREGRNIGISVLFVRNGRLMGSWYGFFKNIIDDDPNALESFIEQYYRGQRYIPDEILLPIEIPDRAIIEEWLASERKVEIRTPKRGILKDLIVMASKNAETSFVQWKKSKERKDEALLAIAELLDLPKKPHRMECFDISNIQGTLPVGSMSVFIDGEPEKREYRHFKIKNITTIDDYAMMEEVLKRRFIALTAENAPDLVVIDGGKGHLNIASKAMGSLGHSSIPLVSIAKERVNSGEPEKIFLPKRKNPIPIRGSSPLFLVMQLRDEAHRFALEYHRKLRKKRGIASVLDDIPGIGEKRKKALLSHFTLVTDIKNASKEELMKVPGITPAIAEAIFYRFSEENR